MRMFNITRIRREDLSYDRFYANIHYVMFIGDSANVINSASKLLQKLKHLTLRCGNEFHQMRGKGEIVQIKLIPVKELYNQIDEN